MVRIQKRISKEQTKQGALGYKRRMEQLIIIELL